MSQSSTVARNVKLLTMTWNVGNAETNPQQFKHLIPERGDGYDLIVLGMQESTYTIGADKNAEPVAPAESAGQGGNTQKSVLLPCVEHLTKQICDHIGSEFYMVSIFIYVQCNY